MNMSFLYICFKTLEGAKTFKDLLSCKGLKGNSLPGAHIFHYYKENSSISNRKSKQVLGTLNVHALGCVRIISFNHYSTSVL